jgi:signal transduction histidine kinase
MSTPDELRSGSAHRCPVSIAREIHDRVMQRLCGVASALASDAPLGPDDRERCSTELEMAIADLRAVILGEPTQPSAAAGGSVVDAVAVACREARDPRVDLTAEGDAQLEPQSAALVRDFVAEAIRNAFKHADPTRVNVSVRAPGERVLVDVHNDGVTGGDRGAGTRLGLRLLAMDGARLGYGIEAGPNGAGLWLTTLTLGMPQSERRFARGRVELGGLA